jgi:hypothetical protein
MLILDSYKLPFPDMTSQSRLSACPAVGAENRSLRIQKLELALGLAHFGATPMM